MQTFARMPIIIDIPPPSHIPQLTIETVLYPSIGHQLSHVRIDGRPVCAVNTTGWDGARIDRLTDMAERIYAKGAL